MKSYIKTCEPDIKYPCLKRLNRWPDLVVLFTGPTTGTVINPHDSWAIGAYYTEWNKEGWSLLKDYEYLELRN